MQEWWQGKSETQQNRMKAMQFFKSELNVNGIVSAQSFFGLEEQREMAAPP